MHATYQKLNHSHRIYARRTLLSSLTIAMIAFKLLLRASSSGAGGRGFDPGPRHRHTCDVITVPVATVLGAQHYEASTG